MSSTRKKPVPNEMFRVVLFLTLLTLVHGIFKTFREDGFAENALENLTDFQIDAVGHSITRLEDGSVVITGILQYPAGMRNHTSFKDEEDIVAYDNSTDKLRYAGMVLRVYSNGTKAWAKRTVLCTFDTTFTSVFDGQFIYVAGGTTGVPEGLGTSECCTDAAGMVLLRYNINGTQEALVVHGDAGERYTSISLTSRESDTLFLASCTPAGTGPYLRDIDQASWPTENGLSISRIRKRDMVSVQQQAITDARSVKGDLINDQFWDMVVSTDGNSIFITAYREVLRFGFSRFPTVFSISGNNLMTLHTRTMENELQVDTRLATSKVSTGVFVSYVDRRANKEFLVVRHMAKDLNDTTWRTGIESTWRFRILLESQFLKEIRSTVKDVLVDEAGSATVLLHSAEVVNRSLAGDSPPESFEAHRKLTNGRPALVVILPSQAVGDIVQAQTAQQWEPYGMVVDDDEYVIGGSDRGLISDGNAKVLLTGVKRETAASPSPAATASASPGASGRPAQSPRASQGAAVDCVGVSTRVVGRGIEEIVRDDKRLRQQMHPRRWGRQAEVLCHSWRNDTDDELCATGDHIVRHWGRAMYMRDFCSQAGCEARVERVLNFKGRCGDEVRMHALLSVTMHAGGRDAAEAVSDECGLMASMKWWWWITTL